MRMERPFRARVEAPLPPGADRRDGSLLCGTPRASMPLTRLTSPIQSKAMPPYEAPPGSTPYGSPCPHHLIASAAFSWPRRGVRMGPL